MLANSRPILFLAVLISAALLTVGSGASCSHEWDSYEVLEDTAGQGAATTSSSSSGGGSLCADYCDVETRCLSTMAMADCLQQCQAEIADCPSGQLENVAGCVQAGQGGCDFGTEVAVCTCLAGSASCFQCL